MTPAGLSPLLTFEVMVGKPMTVDGDAAAGRRFIPIVGGTVSGRYEGVILPGGGDWQTLWPDGRMDLSAHYVLDLGGALVEVQSEGVRQGPPEVLARLAKGEAVDPSEYYFRTSIRLRTGAGELAYLNGRLAVAYGERLADRVRLQIFEVL